ncbi:TPA_asm: P7 [Justicia betacytorhabdovirus 1]|nr:TPA_asm: P7 [Justicia betacytorhabdovirus 1]
MDLDTVKNVILSAYSRTEDLEIPSHIRLILAIVCIILILCTLISLIRLGYSLTTTVLMMVIDVILLAFQFVLLGLILYPIKGAHIIIKLLFSDILGEIVKRLEGHVLDTRPFRVIRNYILNKSLNHQESQVVRGMIPNSEGVWRHQMHDD